MDSEIMVEALPLLGVCNLCLSEGIVKSMLVPYNFQGSKEQYSEMLAKCFSINLDTLQLGDTKPMICCVCVDQLRTATNFRVQVEESLKTLEATAALPGAGLKAESPEPADSFNDDHGNDNNEFSDEAEANMLLSELAVKKEEAQDEEFKQPTKRCQKTARKKTKLRVITLKTTTEPTDTDSMIKAGLFPFKIRKNGFSCAVCSKKYSELDDLKTHTVEHSSYLLHVAFTEMMFNKSQRFHKVSEKLRCKICTANICNYNELKSHLENCTRLKYKQNKPTWNNLPFKLEKDQLDCPVCSKKFINFVSLNTHMNLHYPNYICENCGKAFASKARLRGHIRTHEIGEFPCRYCGSVFDKVTKRENHVSKDHKSGIRYACKRCNISLTSFYARQKHLAEVHNEELKRYKCKACPQSYITPGHLSSHVRRDHLNERNHKCGKCDLAFYTRNSLKMHMIKHDGERIHTCPVCQKCYQRKKTLREHMRIHNNDKRFVCPVCGRAFTQKCTLKGHLKVHDRKLDGDDRAVPIGSVS